MFELDDEKMRIPPVVVMESKVNPPSYRSHDIKCLGYQHGS